MDEPDQRGHDPFDLGRFVAAQEAVYERALSELRRGRKRTHWMWYIFPQLVGLGWSETATRFGLRGIAEAQAYLAHPVLGPRLIECANVVLRIEGRSVSEIFGYPDDMKLRSCATLFELASTAHPVFGRILDKYFRGHRDEQTLDLLDQHREG